MRQKALARTAVSDSSLALPVVRALKLPAGEGATGDLVVTRSYPRVPRRLGGADIESQQSAAHFTAVYEDHVWRVYGFLAYRLGDRQTAEDLTQLTFERALRAWSRYDSRRAAVATWLLRIATNVLIDHQRRDRSAAHRPVEDATDLSSPGPEARFAGSPELLAALERLDSREREILALRYGADLTAAQVAELLGLTVANVQQIASRALRRLRELLEPTSAAPRK